MLLSNSAEAKVINITQKIASMKVINQCYNFPYQCDILWQYSRLTSRL